MTMMFINVTLSRSHHHRIHLAFFGLPAFQDAAALGASATVKNAIAHESAAQEVLTDAWII